MRRLTTALLLILPATGMAQNYPGMGETDTQQMMQQMQRAQACMAGIDQAQLQTFGERAERVDARVKSLCASGKRDEAQQEAVTFAREVNSNPSMLKMRECSRMMSGMPGMPAIPQGPSEDDNRHICDQ
jgi:hypothetical protein